MTQSPAPTASSRGKIYVMSMIAVMTAVTCVLAPMSIPIGEVPISFTNPGDLLYPSIFWGGSGPR